MPLTMPARFALLTVLITLLIGAAGCPAPDGGDALLWVFDYTRGFGASAVAVGPDNNLYFTGKDSIIKLSKDSIQLGGFALGSALTSAPSIGADGTIYVVRADSVDMLYAYAPTGARKWVYRLFGRSHGVFDPPAIGADGTLYLPSAGSPVSYLCAVNPSGIEKWHCSIPEAWCVMPPAIATDGTVYLASNTTLYAVSPAGALKWQAGVDILAWTSPAIGTDGTVYLATKDGCCAITPGGYLRWQVRTDSSVGAQGPVAIGSDGTVYLPDVAACAVGPADSVKWHCPLRGTSPQTPAVGGDGTIYFSERTGAGTENRKDAFCAVSPAGKLLWRHSLGDAAIHGVTVSRAGAVYVATSVGVYAFRNEGSQSGQWPMYQHDARHTGRSGAF